MFKALLFRSARRELSALRDQIARLTELLEDEVARREEMDLTLAVDAAFGEPE